MMKQFFLFILCLTAFIGRGFASPYEAAQKGDVDTLRNYRFEGIDLFLPDERGFIPYELAALYADPSDPESLRKNVEVMLWLKEYKPEMHRYGKASIKLVQAGLADLGYDAGSVDGMLGDKTVEAIKQYQKDNELAETGSLGPHWLGAFHRDLLKSMQKKLTTLGYNTKGSDGLIGPNTETALQKYRKAKDLAQPDYAKLDADLVVSVDGQFDKALQKQQAEKDKAERLREESSTKYLQAGLLTLGYSVGQIDGEFGNRTQKALTSFQKKYKLPRTGKFDSQTKSTFDTAVLKETQRKLQAMGYKTGKPDGKMGPKTTNSINRYKKNNRTGRGGSGLLTYQLVSSVDRNFDAKYAKGKKSSSSSGSSSSSRDKKPATSTKNSASNDKSELKSSNKDVIVEKTSNTKTSSISAKAAKGRMSFQRNSGRVVGCSISGRDIPIEWCEPFYPLPKNNHCEATFKASGAVVNLWCK